MADQTYTGYDAITIAEERGLTLSKAADPIEDAREGLTVEEAQEVAREDAGLISLTLTGEQQLDLVLITWAEDGSRTEETLGSFPTVSAAVAAIDEYDHEPREVYAVCGTSGAVLEYCVSNDWWKSGAGAPSARTPMLSAIAAVAS